MLRAHCPTYESGENSALREASRSGYREYRQGSRQSSVTFVAALQGISGTGQ
jgi:hypothetical protein